MVKHISSFFFKFSIFLGTVWAIFCEILRDVNALSPPSATHPSSFPHHRWPPSLTGLPLPTGQLLCYYNKYSLGAHAAGLQVTLGHCFFLSPSNEQGYSKARAWLASPCILVSDVYRLNCNHPGFRSGISVRGQMCCQLFPSVFIPYSHQQWTDWILKFAGKPHYNMYNFFWGICCPHLYPPCWNLNSGVHACYSFLSFLFCFNLFQTHIEAHPTVQL